MTPRPLRTSDFDYDLPPELIAQHPAATRDASRLLVLDRSTSALRHLSFRDLPSLLRDGDLLVVNDTRVIPARLFGRLRRVGGGEDREVEIFLLREEPSVRPERIWTCLARPARALQVGTSVHFNDPTYSAHVMSMGERGVRHVAFRPAGSSSEPAPAKEDATSLAPGQGGLTLDQVAPGQGDLPFGQLSGLSPPDSLAPGQGDLTLGQLSPGQNTPDSLAPGQVVSSGSDTFAPKPPAPLAPGQAPSFEVWLSRVGHIPLPPYIDRPDEPEDRDRYQTIFARDPGSVAAPTAGLHFTEEVTAAVRARDASIARVTLHVGPGTFRPVASEDPAEHVLDSEPYRVPTETVSAIRAARERGGRILAVGTTAVRSLESWSLAGEPEDGAWRETGLFILPPFEFRVIDGMITNFHLPRSSLLMLVSALAGRERILDAYREAVTQSYRFYSYGDAMLIL